MTNDPRIELTAKVARVETTKVTQETYGRPKGGVLKLTLEVERPRAQSRPPFRYGYSMPAGVTAFASSYDVEQAEPRELRAEAERLRETTTEPSGKRVKKEERTKFERTQQLISELDDYADRLDQWIADSEAVFGRAQRHFAQHGVLAALEGEQVSVVINVRDQGVARMLPGFSALDDVIDAIALGAGEESS